MKRLPTFPNKLPKFSQIYSKKIFKSEISPLISQKMTKFVEKIRLLAMIWVLVVFLSMCIRDCLWLCSNLMFQILEDMLSTKWFFKSKRVLMDYFYSIPIKEDSCSSWLPQQEQQLSQGTMKNSAASQVQSWEREHVIFFKHQYYLTYYLLPVFFCEKKMGLGLLFRWLRTGIGTEHCAMIGHMILARPTIWMKDLSWCKHAKFYGNVATTRRTRNKVK